MAKSLPCAYLTVVVTFIIVGNGHVAVLSFHFFDKHVWRCLHGKLTKIVFVIRKWKLLILCVPTLPGLKLVHRDALFEPEGVRYQDKNTSLSHNFTTTSDHNVAPFVYIGFTDNGTVSVRLVTFSQCVCVFVLKGFAPFCLDGWICFWFIYFSSFPRSVKTVN